jgi:hypothetical protein
MSRSYFCDHFSGEETNHVTLHIADKSEQLTLELKLLIIAPSHHSMLTQVRILPCRQLGTREVFKVGALA